MGTHKLRNDEDIAEILKMALEEESRSGEDLDLRGRLMASARELGLTPEQVAAAEARWEKRERERELLREFRTWRRRRFWRTSGWGCTIAVAAVLMFGAVPDAAHLLEGVLSAAAVLGAAVGLNAWVTFRPGPRADAEYAEWKLRRYDGR